MRVHRALVLVASLGMLTGAGFTARASAAPIPFASDAKASAQDASFLKRSAMTNHAAIDAGNIVLKRSSNDHLKQIAQTVVDTHTKMLEQLEKEGQSAGVTLPTGGDAKAKMMCSKLEHLNGKALDRAFIDGMLQLHRQELQAYKTE